MASSPLGAEVAGVAGDVVAVDGVGDGVLGVAAEDRPGRVSATAIDRHPAETRAPAVSHRVPRARRASP